MDADLFNVLALVLLLAILLALLAGLSTLNSIKNEMAARGGGSTRELSGDLSSAGGGAGSSYDLPSTGATQGGSAYAAETPATSFSQQETGGSEAAYSQPEEVSTGFVSMAEVEPQLASSSGGIALRGDEPEEQPFERDGRWWFKRGGELLVYEEGTGQWVAASGAGGGSASSAETATFPAAGGGATLAASDPGEGWKCSSCGAVNGSTATSCRMCFTPR